MSPSRLNVQTCKWKQRSKISNNNLGSYLINIPYIPSELKQNVISGNRKFNRSYRSRAAILQTGIVKKRSVTFSNVLISVAEDRDWCWEILLLRP